jgi:L-threonylcarbamoyladenylate synthase
LTKIYRDRPEDIAQVIQLLSTGRVVAVPTETVYGLAADTFNESAVSQIFKIKGRPLIDPLIVHTFDLEGVDRLASLNPSANKLAEEFWPGPLTLVLPKKSEVPGIVTANLDSVAVRIPRHPVLRKVLGNSKLCLAAPSANPFTYISPTLVEHVLDSLGDQLEYLLDGGPCPIGMESTIVDITDPTQPVLLRPGVITRDMLSETLGLPVGITPGQKRSKTDKTEAMRAPGMMKKHYSPKTRLVMLELEKQLEITNDKHAAVIYFKRKELSPTTNQTNSYWLTEDGDLAEAAHKLFHLLRAVDQKGYETIYIEAAPEKGIGVAINDRLRRASNGS